MQDFSPPSSLYFCSSTSANENASHSSPGRPYDVFLNHRGPDVKKSLASLIYHWLEDKGLRVFLDVEEFQAGDGLHPTIHQAISSAPVHITIFSTGYAESSWCLDELCSILKSGAKIIPVFYDDVRPSDLRWIGEGKGVYAKAFAEHQTKRRFLSQRLDEWKAALREASYLYGLESYGAEFQGDWGRLLKSLANTVLQAVEENVPLEPARDAVGLDEAVEDFQKFMQGEAQQGKQKAPKIVGIVGLGGSGKTTLAKQFYNIQRSSFTASSFLSDVRYAAAERKLQSLQGKLLKDLLCIDDGNIARSCVSDGRAILRHKLKFSTPRVLIVLDDIDHENQVEDLLDKEALGSDSLILITSRDKTALRKSRADPIYKIKPLNLNHARMVFCRHAFEQPWPKMEFEDLTAKFCEKCGGLPSFLKVMGAHLRVTGNDDTDAWKEELQYIPDDIKNTLKISYDALSKEEKQIFLDVACFFVGEDKSMAVRVWNGSEGRGSTRLQNLENKCLVEVDNNNRLKMHDYLRDFGREIAEDEPRCRIWHSRQILNFREYLKGRREVRGITVATGALSHDSTPSSAFEEIEMSSLKLLAIEGDCFESRFGQLATNLMWLRWYDFPHTSIPSWLISIANLTVLQLIRGSLRQWPACDKQLDLKELKIRSTQLSRISINENVCPHLEHLDVGHSEYLREVKHLPTTLVVLNLESCPILKRISGSFHLPKLQKLSIPRCSELHELPKLSGLISLVTLEAYGCKKLQNLQGLETLGKLQKLSIPWCHELRELPNLSGLTALETLEADSCLKLQNIHGLEHLRKLRKLSIRWCAQLQELPNLSGLISLEKLEADNCRKLQNIQGLEHLRNLQKLSIRWCSELHELPNLSGLTALETLEADSCLKLQNIEGMQHLRKLGKFSVSSCFRLHQLPNLSGLTSLKMLQADNCCKLQYIHGLEHLETLQKLNISCCSELHELPNLSGLTSLETLEARDCIKLQHLLGLERLEKLRHLNIRGCLGLRELPDLSNLSSLKTFQVYGH